MLIHKYGRAACSMSVVCLAEPCKSQGCSSRCKITVPRNERVVCCRLFMTRCEFATRSPSLFPFYFLPRSHSATRHFFSKYISFSVYPTKFASQSGGVINIESLLHLQNGAVVMCAKHAAAFAPDFALFPFFLFQTFIIHFSLSLTLCSRLWDIAQAVDPNSLDKLCSPNKSLPVNTALVRDWLKMPTPRRRNQFEKDWGVCVCVWCSISCLFVSINLWLVSTILEY